MPITRLACRLGLPAVLLLAGLTAAGAQQGTPEARQACTPDAMRLCSQFIPNAALVKRCMLSRVSQLSPACRSAMRGGYGRHYARHHRKGRHAHHRRHRHHH